jgi:hypothetical protein
MAYFVDKYLYFIVNFFFFFRRENPDTYKAVGWIKAKKYGKTLAMEKSGKCCAGVFFISINQCWGSAVFVPPGSGSISQRGTDSNPDPSLLS